MPEKSIRPRLWWRERAILARRTLRKGFINEALTFVSEHDLIRGVEFANAEWMAGWIRLRFLGDSKAAMRHFKKMFLSVRYPISKARVACIESKSRRPFITKIRNFATNQFIQV